MKGVTMYQKSILIVLLLSVSLGLFAGTDLPPVKDEKNPILTLWVIGDMLMPGDARYKDLFGDSQICPKFKITTNIMQSVYLFGGVAFSSRTGSFQIYDLTIDVKNTQLLGTLGAGYQFTLSKSLNAYIEAGGLYVSMKEEGMERTFSGTGFGFCAEGGVTLTISGPLKLGLHAGYSQATVESPATTDQIDLTAKPGGLTLGLGLGLSL
jgi:hypothetical protein